MWTAHEYSLGALGALQTDNKHHSIRSKFAELVLGTRKKDLQPLESVEELLSLADGLFQNSLKP